MASDLCVRRTSHLSYIFGAVSAAETTKHYPVAVNAAGAMAISVAVYHNQDITAPDLVRALLANSEVQRTVQEEKAGDLAEIAVALVSVYIAICEPLAFCVQAASQAASAMPLLDTRVGQLAQ